MTRALMVSMALATSVACSLAGSHNRRGGWSPERVERLTPELQASYRVFAHRCSRCHLLSRPLGAGIEDPEHWHRYVARMRRMSGSGISSVDAKQVLLFLEAHAGWVRASRGKKGEVPTWWDGPETASSR